MGEGGAYYNEIDPFAAAWLRELITAGHIAPGIVDERDIRDVRPDELARFTQCHFFAGIGVWSYALRRAGWPDDRPVWTGSCPCQPFSAAGKGAGFADERHLWPAFHWLIAECGPVDILGEQVASGNVDPWLDLVQADVEGMGYAFGCVPVPAAGFGAPNIRDRAFWVAHADGAGRQLQPSRRPAPIFGAAPKPEGREQQSGADSASAFGGVVDSESRGQREFGRALEQRDVRHADGGCDAPVRLDDADVAERRPDAASGNDSNGQDTRWAQGAGDVEGRGRNHWTGPTNGFWRDADWLGCRDGKWRPVEPGTFPLAHGSPARVGRLRGYGNAINAEVATGFVEAVIGHLTSSDRLAA